MVVRELQSLQRTLPEKIAAFERQRLLNLIDSKIKRREIESATAFAEELFKREVRYALITRTRLLTKTVSTLWKIIDVLSAVFFVFTVLTVLNVRPFFSLLAEAVAMTCIITSFFVDRFLVKRLARTVEIILDVYDNGRETFVEKALTKDSAHIDPEDFLRVSI